MKRADKILKDNEEILHKLSLELLEREILDSEEIDKIINGEILPPVIKEVTNSETIIDEEEIPDHVLKLMGDKKKRSGKEGDESN
jgi:cell division protease FtsH